MRSPTSLPKHQFHGYVYFDDPDWWRGFKLTEECARAIDHFRKSVLALQSKETYAEADYERAISRIWEASEDVANRMEWHTTRNIALMVELSRIYDDSVRRILDPVSYYVRHIRDNLRVKAWSIRSLLTTMHDVPCAPSDAH